MHFAANSGRQYLLPAQHPSSLCALRMAVAKYQIKPLLLNVVVRESPAVLQLLAGKDEPLLVRWDALLILMKKVTHGNPS